MYAVNNSIETLSYNQLQIQKLVKTDTLEILCISLEKGTVFPEHTSPKYAQLVVLEGSIEFHIKGEVFQLKKHQNFAFPKASPHWVEALENSKFLIIR